MFFHCTPPPHLVHRLSLLRSLQEVTEHPRARAPRSPLRAKVGSTDGQHLWLISRQDCVSTGSQMATTSLGTTHTNTQKMASAMEHLTNTTCCLVFPNKHPVCSSVQTHQHSNQHDQSLLTNNDQ